MRYAPQSSPPGCRLPACIACILLLLPGSAELHAQARSEVRATTIHGEPQGVLLARIPGSVTLTLGATRRGWREVVLDGWVATALLRSDRRNGFDLSVSGDDVRLRAAPDGAVIAHMQEGMLLDRVGSRGRWTHVRRKAWVRSDALRRPAGKSTERPAEADPPARAARDTADATAAYAPMQQAAASPAAAPPTAERPGSERMEMARATPLSTVPDGPAAGNLAQGAGVTVVGRAGEWARVQVEGWVRASELTPTTGGPLVGVTAAEVRANPERYVGETVEWRLQYVSTAVADELRPEMPPGQPYVLARGPLPEPGFVYLMVTPEELARIRSLPALTELTVRALVRASRTRFLATPVLELRTLVAPTVTTR